MKTEVGRLKRRADFLRLARQRRKAVTPGMLLQAAPTPDALCDDGQVRVGFTVSKKVGNAVRRNRAKRRLRALVAELFPDHVIPGHDIAVIGRFDTVDRSYSKLRRDMISTMRRAKVWRDAG